QRRALGLAQGRRSITAAEQGGHVAALLRRQRNNQGTCAFAAHAVRQPGARPLDGEHSFADGAPVRRTGKAAAAEPLLQKAVQRLLGGSQAFQYLDRHLQPGGGCHGYSSFSANGLTPQTAW